MKNLPSSPEPRPQGSTSDTAAVAMDHVSASRSALSDSDTGSGMRDKAWFLFVDEGNGQRPATAEEARQFAITAARLDFRDGAFVFTWPMHT